MHGFPKPCVRSAISTNTAHAQRSSKSRRREQSALKCFLHTYPHILTLSYAEAETKHNNSDPSHSDTNSCRPSHVRRRRWVQNDAYTRTLFAVACRTGTRSAIPEQATKRFSRRYLQPSHTNHNHIDMGNWVSWVPFHSMLSTDTSQYALHVYSTLSTPHPTHSLP
jgi:hypothetical protein